MGFWFKAKLENAAHLLQLPDLILVAIFDNLSRPRDRRALGSACRRLRALLLRIETQNLTIDLCRKSIQRLNGKKIKLNQWAAAVEVVAERCPISEISITFAPRYESFLYHILKILITRSDLSSVKTVRMERFQKKESLFLQHVESCDPAIFLFLVDCTKLQCLELKRIAVHADFFSLLLTDTPLKRLSLQNTTSTDVNVAQLVNAMRHEAITELAIEGWPPNFSFSEFLCHLRPGKLKKLRTLRLVEVFRDRNDIEAVGEMAICFSEFCNCYLVHSLDNLDPETVTVTVQDFLISGPTSRQCEIEGTVQKWHLCEFDKMIRDLKMDGIGLFCSGKEQKEDKLKLTDLLFNLDDKIFKLKEVVVRKDIECLDCQNREIQQVALNVVFVDGDYGFL